MILGPSGSGIVVIPSVADPVILRLHDEESDFARACRDHWALHVQPAFVRLDRLKTAGLVRLRR